MSWRKVLFAAGLTVGALLFLQQIWEIYLVVSQGLLRLANPIWLVAALPLETGAYFIQVLAWYRIMKYLGVFLDLRRAVQSYFLSFLPRYIPGSVWGYWSRSEWLKQTCGIKYAESIAASVLEAAALVLTAIFVVCGWFSLHATGWKGPVFGLASIGVLGVTWLTLPSLVLKIWQRLGREKETRQTISNKKKGALSTWTTAVALYLLLWGLHGSSVFLVSLAVRPISPGLAGATFVMALAWLSGFITVIVPAGIGVRELTLSTLLATHFGFLSWQASLVAITSRFVVVLAEAEWLLAGVILLACDRWEQEGANEETIGTGQK